MQEQLASQLRREPEQHNSKTKSFWGSPSGAVWVKITQPEGQTGEFAAVSDTSATKDRAKAGLVCLPAHDVESIAHQSLLPVYPDHEFGAQAAVAVSSGESGDKQLAKTTDVGLVAWLAAGQRVSKAQKDPCEQQGNNSEHIQQQTRLRHQLHRGEQPDAGLSRAVCVIYFLLKPY